MINTNIIFDEKGKIVLPYYFCEYLKNDKEQNEDEKIKTLSNWIFNSFSEDSFDQLKIEKILKKCEDSEIKDWLLHHTEQCVLINDGSAYGFKIKITGKNKGNIYCEFRAEAEENFENLNSIDFLEWINENSLFIPIQSFISFQYHINNISQTSELMKSENYEEKFIAEYYQTKIRYENLQKIIVEYDAGNNYLNYTPKEIEFLLKQIKVMSDYIHILKVRAKLEDILL